MVVGHDGLFVGLCTLDVIQLIDHVPAANEKMVAERQTVAAGGPATNAAATFAHLGGAATLLTGIGRHPLTTGIHADLRDLGVQVVDLDPSRTGAPSVSTIMVTAASGARAVVSTNASADRLSPPGNLAELVGRVNAVQVDGHHPEVAVAALRCARELGRLTIMDAGSWKPGTQDLLPMVDVAACSADFRPPGTSGTRDTVEYLRSCGVPWIVVTRGGEPIRWWGPPRGCAGVHAGVSAGEGCAGEAPVPAVAVVDTLGAGDVFHGALTYGLATSWLPDRSADGSCAVDGAVDSSVDSAADRFARLVTRAAAVASAACGSFGTRTWMRTGAAVAP